MDTQTHPDNPDSECCTSVSAVTPRRWDDLIIKTISLVLVGAVVTFAVLSSSVAANAIGSFRTFVTGNFTWYFVTLATVALAFCVYMASGQRGKVVLGGKDAKPEYGRFAWYSMLFACGQGIGLIFWSVAEPILVKDTNPIQGHIGVDKVDGALIWSYFHWAVHAWAIYCVVALCLALSFHNRNKAMTFRDALVGIFPEKLRRPIGVIVEIVAILATVFGLSTSFAFAAMQLSSGLGQTFGLENYDMTRTIIIVGIGVFAAASVYLGIEKGMKRISEVNSILSIALLVGLLLAGPTLYLLSILPQTAGGYLWSMWWMGTWTDASSVVTPLQSWSDSWNGIWTVFIWCWCWAFSPFVGSFIARISRGRSVREFVVGVLGIPSMICVIWIGVVGGSALFYDETKNGIVTKAVEQDTSLGLFVMLGELPYQPVAFALLLAATILVGTYYLTSLDSGVHALSGFVSSASRPSRLFSVALVAGIAIIAFLLLSIGGESVVGTVQTGTIIGALPYTLVVLLMMLNTVRYTNRDLVPQLGGSFPASSLIKSRREVFFLATDI
ncbi:Glycine betaine transporter BetP [Actinomyces bovis]|uniref:Glycine betaine transporter BetP n=1 Tax=Actinomyces bovis TaxID=1658 RepID=A0ABY1VTA9_9ACTO|nr:BCCT family transporter [Actinomyces bovis]SPT54268.1 Glycine betaine transporter BetP [Actinomyces bovis]VEG56418.1 Glycine betaine transporter BetP [Actinomyces israelii]